MGDKVFRFKKFEVRNEKAAMKVNTDGVLLGAAAGLDFLLERTPDGPPVRCLDAGHGFPLKQTPVRCLDAGTGNGTIALILAQRLSAIGIAFHVTGIDIDGPSALEAGENFAASPWPEHLTVRHLPLQKCDGTFDLIVSNPPYYDSSLTNPDERKTTARHTADADEEGFPDSPLSYRTLMEFAEGHLGPGGRLSLILPSDREGDLLRCARGHGLYPCRILRVWTVPGKSPSRIVAEFSRSRGESEYQELTIMADGKNTPAYTALVKDLYLWA